MAIKLKKTLYVGLGGTGAATLLRVKKCFIDSYGEIPPMIGFLAIDTDTAAYNKEVTSNVGKSIRLEQNELLVCTVKNALPTYKNNPKIYDWVPSDNVSKLSSIAGQGAGAVRSNGRFIAYYNYKTIEDNIKSAITRIHQLIPQDSPYTVDTNKNGIEYPTTINVFSSVAGGTGSGMIVDTISLINKAMGELSLQYDLYPWLVLPEIFKAINNGPAMANVMYNAYGTLRTLDYLEHLDPNAPAINFGYTNINERPFRYAYLINNLNQAGVAFDKLDDLLDVIAKSAFLPANKMGDDLTSPFDNIKNQQDGGVYDIHNKKAWAASVGSAELIYDSQAVGRAIAYRSIAQLCESMMGGLHSGVQTANDFVDHQDVLIRENNGRNDVIDALLNPAPEYQLNIDQETSEVEINNYIDYHIGQRLEKNIKENFNAKLSRAKSELHSKVAELMDNTPSGCLGVTSAFLSALKTIIAECNGEMIEEQKQFNERNTQPTQWAAYLNQVPKSGLSSIFSGSKVDEDAVAALDEALRNHVTSLREEQRRLWAIRFYNDLTQEIVQIENNLTNLISHVVQIQEKYRNQLLSQQQLAASTSKFQIFLHQKAVNGMGVYNINDSLKVNFHQHFTEMGGLAQWLGLSREQIDKQLWNFVKDTSDVAAAVNTGIDDVLKTMSTEEITSYLEQLKVLAAPLWTYNTAGYQSSVGAMDRFVIVGVGNRDTSLIKNDPAYNTIFDTNGNPASFASTHQHDRIYLLVVEDLLPIYAVNNYSTYEGDYHRKIAQGVHLASYIDEKLNNRINSENFSIMPVNEKDNMLQLWVYGFVFGYIDFDTDTNQYWIRSKSRGSAIHKYRFNLNQRRDVAFDIFKSEGLYREIETLMNVEIQAHGVEPINSKIEEIKRQDNYLSDYAKLSPLEAANLEHPNFKSVLSLMEQEIGLMTI